MNEDRVASTQLVTTIREKCRMCYTCVRECPVKAIAISDGQASVIETRCIGCGNCVTVCSQNAKEVLSGIADTDALLASSAHVAAIVAPSHPAEFTDCDTATLVAALRDLGFDSVHEVAFGADLVARAYAELLAEDRDGRYMATPCPAVVSYVRKYQPDLVDNLAPIVSPMIALARALHRRLGPEARIVFIGPCIAKKGEASYEQFEGDVDAALTFVELRAMFARKGIVLASRPADDDFDPPHGALGGLFPLTRGLLRAAGLSEDLLTGDIVSADGRHDFAAAIEDFKSGATEARLLDILCCHGCVMGAGFTHEEPVFTRRAEVSRAARERQRVFDQAAWEAAMAEFADLDLSRTFTVFDQRLDHIPPAEELQAILERMGKSSPKDLLDCGACGYDTCREHAIAVWQGLAEIEMCLPYAVERLRRTVDELEEANHSLESTREALVKSESLASMGQLAAGIAHEVNNPLGILLLHANLLLEECDNDPLVAADAKLIVNQANRCKKIISGLLNFARQSRVVRQPTDLRALVKDVLRTFPREEDVEIVVNDQMADPVAEIDGDQIVQVITNMLANAQHAMPDGGRITITLDGTAETVQITISDQGTGIAPDHLDKLFSPFFTTKQVGRGTGLGLAVSHGIVKMHRGQIAVESNADPDKGPTFTTFTISLPRSETETDAAFSLREMTSS
ncbi:MAG TPA: [Fe-Fe] hydrogenase large subunit C-terminal domain-containing protein [Thermoleophilia bacterium]|nr:[Fe-Fe] hydrogenase large subunit C-terminal domain-containing protein [Thermoleophilia bacterium]HQJ97213.1 [Fe-Fe] hydrogenase large subunit C-terminal domain-containing protein [Thermoleophilia bacterium]